VDNEYERKDSKLVNWTKLPDEIKDKNRKAIKDIPTVLDNLGQLAVRLPENTEPANYT
jgi:hypothetical protein